MFESGMTVSDARIISRSSDVLSEYDLKILKDLIATYDISKLTDDECTQYANGLYIMYCENERNKFFDKRNIDLELTFSHNAYGKSFWVVS